MRKSVSKFRPAFEALEDRLTPAIGTSFNALTATLTITEGTGGATDDISVSAIPPSAFATVSTVTVINDTTAAVISTTAGVRNIVVNFGSGNDSIQLGGTTAATANFALNGNLNITHSGFGNLWVNDASTGLGLAGSDVISGNLSISSGTGLTTATGGNSGTPLSKVVMLNHLAVRGAMNVSSTAGNTLLVIGNATATDGAAPTLAASGTGGNNSVGSLTVTSGAGFDEQNFVDLSVTNSVSINDGAGNTTGAIAAGSVSGDGAALEFTTDGTAGAKSTIGGSVGFTSGSGISDVVMDNFSNTTFTQNGMLGFFSGAISAPVSIKGSLTLNLSTNIAASVNEAQPSEVVFGDGTPTRTQLQVTGATTINESGNGELHTVIGSAALGAFTYKGGSSSFNTLSMGDTDPADAFGFTVAYTNDAQGVTMSSANVNLGTGGSNRLFLSQTGPVVLTSTLVRSAFSGGNIFGSDVNPGGISPFATGNFQFNLTPTFHQFASFP